MADTAEIVTFAVPVSVMVTYCALEFTTVKFPKLTLVELVVSCEDSAVFAVPVPDNERFSAEFEASLDTDSVPCTLPEPFGSKITVIVMD